MKNLNDKMVTSFSKLVMGKQLHFNVEIEKLGFAEKNFNEEWRLCNKNEKGCVHAVLNGKDIYAVSLTESIDDLEEELDRSYEENMDTLSYLLLQDLETMEYKVSYKVSDISKHEKINEFEIEDHVFCKESVLVNILNFISEEVVEHFKETYN